VVKRKDPNYDAAISHVPGAALRRGWL
jgi:hypothetical protein